ncbi:MAG: hypothetical protein HC806_01970 [Anaerolineae bacterium]|nr:hypothetical protein [Anaerolineae bacterium]
MPNFEDSEEFFSPPIPYILPALVLKSNNSSMWAAAKSGQLLNVVLSLGITFLLLKICGLIKPEDHRLKLAALCMLGILPVYYKTFSMVRGEPFVAFLYLVIVHLTLKIYQPKQLIKPSPNKSGIWEMLLMGIYLGLVILARQWGFFIFPALGVFVFIQQFKIDGQNGYLPLGLLL